jgi:hypothetical protein
MPQLPQAPDLTALLDAREARAAQLHALQLRAMQRQMGRADKAYANRGNFEGGVGQPDPQRKMQDLQLEAMQREVQDATSGPPLKMIGQGANMIPGYGLDTNAMNSNQRKMFLPGSSVMANDGLTAGESGDIEARSSVARATGADPGRSVESPHDPYRSQRRALLNAGYGR